MALGVPILKHFRIIIWKIIPKISLLPLLIWSMEDSTVHTIYDNTYPAKFSAHDSTPDSAFLNIGEYRYSTA